LSLFIAADEMSTVIPPQADWLEKSPLCPTVDHVEEDIMSTLLEQAIAAHGGLAKSPWNKLEKRAGSVKTVKSQRYANE
jgi:hypothetical protein